MGATCSINRRKYNQGEDVVFQVTELDISTFSEEELRDKLKSALESIKIKDREIEKLTKENDELRARFAQPPKEAVTHSLTAADFPSQVSTPVSNSSPQIVNGKLNGLKNFFAMSDSPKMSESPTVQRSMASYEGTAALNDERIANLLVGKRNSIRVLNTRVPTSPTRILSEPSALNSLWGNTAVSDRLARNIQLSRRKLVNKTERSNSQIDEPARMLTTIKSNSILVNNQDSPISVGEGSDPVDAPSVMLDFLFKVSGTLDMQSLLASLEPLVGGLAGVERCTIWAINYSVSEIVTCSAAGIQGNIVVPLADTSIVGNVAIHGKPIHITDAYSDRRFNSNIDKQTGFKTRNVLCIPIYKPDGFYQKVAKVTGVLQLMNTYAEDFDESDMQLMQYIQKIIGVVLYNAMQYDAMYKMQKRTQLILDVTNELNQRVHQYDDVKNIVSQYQDHIGAERASLFVVDKAKQQLTIHTTTQHLNMTVLPLSPDGGIACTVALNGTPVVTNDTRSHPMFNASVDQANGFETRQMACLPIKDEKGAVVGVLQMINKKGRENRFGLQPNFTEEDVELMLALNAQVAMLFKNIAFRESEIRVRELETEQQRLQWEEEVANHLLTSLIPYHVAQQLKDSGAVNAEQHPRVTLLFSDIVGFTKFSSEVSPNDVIMLLNEMFSLFDKLVDALNVFKVETVGDAYMVVAGLDWMAKDPLGRSDAELIALMASGMMQAVKSMPCRSNGYKPRIRIGIHTGCVMAGVVGEKMPRYHLFGDTVNTASRVESTGVPDRIQISQSTADALAEEGLVQDTRSVEGLVRELGAATPETSDFQFSLELRGNIEVKGKANMDMYLLDEINPVDNLDPFESFKSYRKMSSCQDSGTPIRASSSGQLRRSNNGPLFDEDTSMIKGLVEKAKVRQLSMDAIDDDILEGLEDYCSKIGAELPMAYRQTKV